MKLANARQAGRLHCCSLGCAENAMAGLGKADSDNEPLCPFSSCSTCQTWAWPNETALIVCCLVVGLRFIYLTSPSAEDGRQKIPEFLHTQWDGGSLTESAERRMNGQHIQRKRAAHVHHEAMRCKGVSPPYLGAKLKCAGTHYAHSQPQCLEHWCSPPVMGEEIFISVHTQTKIENIQDKF